MPVTAHDNQVRFQSYGGACNFGRHVAFANEETGIHSWWQMGLDQISHASRHSLNPATLPAGHAERTERHRLLNDHQQSQVSAFLRSQRRSMAQCLDRFLREVHGDQNLPCARQVHLPGCRRIAPEHHKPVQCLHDITLVRDLVLG
jgi:hypothetical protein